MVEHRAWLDAEWEEVTVAEVRDADTHWEIRRSDGWSFMPAKAAGIVPRVGSVLRFWGRGIGSVVRGLAVDGAVMFYETAAENHARLQAEHDAQQRARRGAWEREGRAKQQAQYEALPSVFRERIDRFRANNPDFGWEYEGYELFCCEQAVVIAEACKTPDAIRSFHDLPWREQLAAVPGMSEDHSGNTFGAACALALLYVERPEWVAKMHGALSPLVGSAAYGDMPVDARP